MAYRPNNMAYEPPFMPYEPFLWGVGVVFNLLITLRAKGTLISEPRFSTPCEMRLFPREKGKKQPLFRAKPTRQRPFSLSRVGKSHISQGVENRGSLISVPLAASGKESTLYSTFPQHACFCFCCFFFPSPRVSRACLKPLSLDDRPNDPGMSARMPWGATKLFPNFRDKNPRHLLRLF